MLPRFLCPRRCEWRLLRTTRGDECRGRWFQGRACIRGNVWRCLRGSSGRVASAISGPGLVGSIDAGGVAGKRRILIDPCGETATSGAGNIGQLRSILNTLVACHYSVHIKKTKAIHSHKRIQIESPSS